MITTRYDPPGSGGRLNVPESYAGRLDAEGNQLVPYGRSWDETAKAYLEKHPYCERCLKHGKHVKAALVHHKVYVKNGGKDGAHNLEALCHSCHEYEHKRHKADRFDEEASAMNEIDKDLEKLKRYEAELYRGKAAADEAARTDEAEDPEEALKRLKEAEAHMYEKEA